MDTGKAIGIVGGQGPESTAAFYMRIVHYYRTYTGAHFPGQLPPMVVFSAPAPGPVDIHMDVEGMYAVLADTVQKLEGAGCGIIAIVCSSHQFLIPRLQPLVRIPIVNMAKTVAEKLRDEPYKTVGLLGTATLLRRRTYQDALAPLGIATLVPDGPDQQAVGEYIIRAACGISREGDKASLLDIVGRLHRKGAEAVLLGCAELPLAILPGDTAVPLVDCSEMYARAIVHSSSVQRLTKL